jgi:hypothetical protein
MRREGGVLVASECMAPFETIESAQEFLGLLLQAVWESRAAVAEQIKTHSPTDSARHLEALNLIMFNLDKLGVQLKRSRRVLNDLRTLRRLLHERRTDKVA